jgi:hypothetical protein
MTTLASRMIVNARSRKSFAFPRGAAARFSGRHAVVRQLHHKRNRLAAKRRALEQQRNQHRKHDARGVEADHHQRLIPRKERRADTA